MQGQRVRGFVSTALECSIYHSPDDIGLTADELVELGSRFNFGRGEIIDQARQADAAQPHVGPRIMPSTSLLHDFNFTRDPEYRNRDAFQEVYDILREHMRHEGRAAGLPREVLIERAVQQGRSRRDVEVALTILSMEKQLTRGDGVVRLTGTYASPREQGRSGHVFDANAERAAIYAAVGDIISRRTDGRPKSSDAFLAFAERLDALGHGPFRMWWTQTVQEVRVLDRNQSPTAMLVLAAALVEGALTFVVGYARKVGKGPMGSTEFERPPKTWKIDHLINSAAQGGKDAILDDPAKGRAVRLINTRQRIHAGRMLEEHSKGVPDLRPEEAREALATAELVTRSVLDWVDAHPVE